MKNIETYSDLLVKNTINFVKETLKNAESGHDWFHIERVWKNSITIANKHHEIEKVNEKNIDLLIVQLGALLHDIADHKFHNGDDSKGSLVAREFLLSQNVDDNIIDAVCYIITHISYKGSACQNEMNSIEGKIVQDADRLDAIGAIGIGRAFAYGGFRNRKMYIHDEQPNLTMDWDEYKKNQGTTINHFYEKLLLIKDKMNTRAGKDLAEKRHQYMIEFVETFIKEWNCDL
jgi:uncharacterized protein